MTKVQSAAPSGADLGEVTAPAKINLCLHIIGQRSDGYHLLDSLVAQLALHDTLSMRLGSGFSQDSLSVDGGVIDGAPEDNLVIRAVVAARRHLSATGWRLPFIDAGLKKALPVAAGLGGGSSDAVAALKLVASYAAAQGHPIEAETLEAIALELGADCPLFLKDRPVRMRGIGEQLTEATGWGGLNIVLVNPNVPVSTPKIFCRLEKKEQSEICDLPSPRASTGERLAWLANQTRNDLQPPAIALEPAIDDVLQALRRSEHCALARMSGSGATCFGIFESKEAAAESAVQIEDQYPHWWVAQTRTIGNT